MPLSRLLYLLGFIAIIWAVISGINFKYHFVNDISSFESSYSFKIGLFVIGILFLYLGRRSKKA
jgi:hypothetical protein